jgi:hypothetical protein
MARQEPGDLLGQLDHEPVWIEEVEGPVPPRPVDRAGEELDVEPRSRSASASTSSTRKRTSPAGPPSVGARWIRSEARVRSRSPNLVSPVTNSAYPASRSLKGSPTTSRENAADTSRSRT